MFKTESKTPHVKPVTLWQHFWEAEERTWGQGMVDESTESSNASHSSDVGELILRHGTIVRKIQEYFSNLEARKCCLKLRLEARKTTFSNIRLVRHDGRDSGIEEGAMKRTPLEHRMNVAHLDPNEFRVFKRAYLCAAFPVLGAPEPPSAFSPSPVQNASNQRSNYSGILSISRPTTPYSIPDSGLEDTEEDTTSLIPSETLCELLKRAFRLSDEKFRHYERSICESYGKHTQQKVLAEELVNQLAALENNSNPFYNPHSFKDDAVESHSDPGRKGYDTWQQQQREHLTELMGKFWQFSLPSPSVNFSAELVGVHDDYRRLLAKLISYESPYRAETEDLGPAPASSLSSASVRLLKEFGLRYGVGEQYKKFVYLHYLAQHFDVTIWYIQHVISTLKSIMEWLPSNRNFLTITKQEFMIIETSLHLLLGLAGNAISKMKRVFSQNRPPEGVASLIELLGLSLALKSYFSMNPSKPLEDCLRKYLQDAFVTAYERHKMLGFAELQQTSSSVQICPKLLNILIMNIRDEVTDYKVNYQTTFESFFNVTEMAAQAFYSYLISDTLQLCQTFNENVTTPEIDLLLLSLAYRLNSLDHDWARYIPPESQRWREPFVTLSIQWTLALHSYCPLFVVQAIEGDKFQSLLLPSNLRSSSLSSSSQRGRSTSLRSLSASVRSAFSSVSSNRSTPVLLGKESLDVPGKFVNRQSPIMEASGDNSLPSITKEQPTSSSKLMYSSSNENTEPLLPRRSSSHSVDTALFLRNQHDSISSDIEDCEEVMTFTQHGLRHSNSLPNFNKENPIFPDSFVGINKNNLERSVTPNLEFARNQQVSVEKPGEKVKNYNQPNDSVSNNESESEDEELIKNYPPLQLVSGTSRVSHFEGLPDKNIPRINALIGGNFDQSKPGFSNVAAKGMIRVPSAPLMSATNPSHMFPNQSLLRSPNADNIEQELMDSLRSDFTFGSLGNQPTSTDVQTSVAPLASSIIDLLVLLQRVVGVGKAFCDTICPVISNSTHRSHGYWDNVSFTSDDLEDVSYCRDNAGARGQLFFLYSKIVCENLCLYADNLLCLDLCGIPLSLAKRLIGPKLVDHVQTQRQGGLIWGCRHDIEGSTTDCFYYFYRKTFLLCDRYEQVSEEMCTRINSIAALFDYLKKYYEQICTVFGLHDDQDVTKFVGDETEETGYESGFLDDFVVIDNHYGDLETDYQPYMDELSIRSTPRTTPVPGMKVPIFPVSQCWRHVMSVLRAMCRILAYRLNLFIRDALALLLSPDMKMPSLTNRLQPVIDFLSAYLSALSDWLYGDCFRQMLQFVWLYIVEDFEEEVSKLRTGEYNTESQAELLTQALSHLLKFMNNYGKGVNVDHLLAYSENISFKLQLYTLTTPVLTSLYEKLFAYYSCSNDVRIRPADLPLGILRRMKIDLLSRRKCFSGRQLVSWLLRHQEKAILTGGSELSDHLDPDTGRPLVSREKAQSIAQKLLVQGVILDIEADSSVSGDRQHGSSFLSKDFPYPNISIHSDLEQNQRRSEKIQSTSDKSRSSSNSSASTIKDTDSVSRSNSFSFKKGIRRQNAVDLTPSISNTTGALKVNSSNTAVEQTYSEQNGGQAPSSESKAPSIDSFTNGDNLESIQNATQVANGSNEDSTKYKDSHIPDESKQICEEQKESSEPQEITFKRTDVTLSDIAQHSLSALISNKLHAEETKLGKDNMSNTSTPKSASNRTPKSSISQDTSSWATSNTSCQSFKDDPKKFYTFSLEVDGQFGDGATSGHQRGGKIHRELLTMVETCFHKKITPEFLLLILYARRKYDQTAKKFFKTIPEAVIHRLCEEVGAPCTACSGS